MDGEMRSRVMLVDGEDGLSRETAMSLLSDDAIDRVHPRRRRRRRRSMMGLVASSKRQRVDKEQVHNPFRAGNLVAHREIFDVTFVVLVAVENICVVAMDAQPLGSDCLSIYNATDLELRIDELCSSRAVDAADRVSALQFLVYSTVAGGCEVELGDALRLLIGEIRSNKKMCFMNMLQLATKRLAILEKQSCVNAARSSSVRQEIKKEYESKLFSDDQEFMQYLREAATCGDVDIVAESPPAEPKDGNIADILKIEASISQKDMRDMLKKENFEEDNYDVRKWFQKELLDRFEVYLGSATKRQLASTLVTTLRRFPDVMLPLYQKTADSCALAAYARKSAKEARRLRTNRKTIRTDRKIPDVCDHVDGAVIVDLTLY